MCRMMGRKTAQKLFGALYAGAGAILAIFFLKDIVMGEPWENIGYIAIYAALGALILLLSARPKREKGLMRKAQAVLLATGIILAGGGIATLTVAFGVRWYTYDQALAHWEMNPPATVVAQSNVDYLAFPKVLRCSNGSLWAVWYVSRDHHGSGNSGKLASAWSHDDGATWTVPVVIADDATYDTRNPAIMEADGQFVLSYELYNSETGDSIKCQYINTSNGCTWSAPQDIVIPSMTWMSPFHNVVNISGQYYSAFYGEETSLGASTSTFLLHWTGTGWELASFIASYNPSTGVGFDETAVVWNGTHAIAIMRTAGTKKTLHVAISSGGIASWGTAQDTGIWAHAPDAVLLPNKSLYVAFREVANRTLEGRMWDPNSVSLAGTPPETLFGYRASSTGDYAYPSITLLGARLGIIHYEVYWDFWGMSRTGTIYFQPRLL